MKKLAIIDDYEHAAHEFADWSSLADRVDVSVFNEHFADPAELVEHLKEFSAVVIMRERTPFTRQTIASLPKLELLITSGMRNASIDTTAAKEHGVVVAGTPILPYPAAEHAWALILALAKRIPQDDSAVRRGHWGQSVNLGLNGKTLGVVGLGKLGAQVARVGLAFQMNVIAWSENLTAQRCAEIGVTHVGKDALFRESDFITVHLVLSERSRGTVGRHELESMKSSAFLINTSRGPIVDEAALVDALSTGLIAGAGLDVFDIEPLPADHPLRTAANAIVTPHQGYVTRENFEIFFRTAVENVRAWLEGAPINLLI